MATSSVLVLRQMYSALVEDDRLAVPAQPCPSSTSHGWGCFLPPLGRDSAARRLHILIDRVIDNAAASAGIDSAFGGKTITERGRTVTIATASVAPLARGRLAIAASFTGDARGTLRLVGSQCTTRCDTKWQFQTSTSIS